MELVSPIPKQKQADTTNYQIPETNYQPSIDKTPTKTNRTQKQDFFKKETIKEEIVSIENDLFIASISSRYGGTFNSFLLKNYFDSDSQNINLINNNFKENLTIKIINENGLPFDLSSPWKLAQPIYGGHISKPTTIRYVKEVMKDVFVYKTLVFYPNTYKIDCKIETINNSNTLFNNSIDLGWVGGIKPSEQNIEDDHVYFQSFVFLGGEEEKLKVKKGKPETISFNGSPEWSAIRTKYFAAILLPKNPNLINKTTISGEKNDKQETYSTSFFYIRPEPINISLYLGPLEFSRIKDLNENLERIMDFGWAFVRPISKIVLLTLTKMHQYIPNYGFILILFSILVKIIVYPLTKKSYQSTSEMQKIQPELMTIREKYKSNPQKLNQAQMQLYKKRGVNPLGGCLPMLIQMPLLFSLFIVFRTTIELRAEPFIWWIKDLSVPDAVVYLPFKIPLYGSHIAILPIFMVISMFIQQRMMTGGIQQPQQKTMQYFMTAFFFLIFNSFPSGLNLYYTLFNVLTILQQKLIPNTKPNINDN